MANLYNWSTTAADNDDAGTPINWAENQLPATVNNSARELMKQVADFRNLLSGAKISSGTNTTTLTTGMSLSSYAQGTLFAFEQGVTNTGAVTINVDSIGAKDIKKHKTVALVAGDLVAGGLYIIAYEATAGNFQLISPTAQIPATQTGAETLTNKTLVSPVLNTGVSGTAFLNENNLASNSASKLASQQSIKTYADALKSATETLSNKTITSPVLNTSISGSAFLDEDNMASNSNNKLSSQQAIKAYADNLKSVSETLTNKTLTAPAINGVVGGTAVSQTITTLSSSNVDGILGANTAKAATVTTLAMGGALSGVSTGAFSGLVTAATAPTNAAHLVNKAYVDDLITNVGQRTVVRAATTANITIATALNNGDTLDGVTLATNDLVLVKNQSSAAENGVYKVAASPARAPFFDTFDEYPGSIIVVSEGSVNDNKIFSCTSNKGGSLGSTAITWAQITPAATALNNLTDVTISSPQTGQALTYNGSQFVNGSGGGGQYFGNNGTTGSSAGDIFRANAQSLTANETIPSSINASCTGPLSVAANVTLTVEGVLAIL